MVEEKHMKVSEELLRQAVPVCPWLLCRWGACTSSHAATEQSSLVEKTCLPAQASARRSAEDGFGSVMGPRSRQQSYSPLSPATGTSVRPSQAQTNGLQDSGRPGDSRRGRSGSPSSPTLQPKTTPRIAQTPTLGTGEALHTLLTQCVHRLSMELSPEI